MYCLLVDSFVAKDFHCLSFDYNFIIGNQQSTCHLSQYIAANVYGLVASPTKRTLHFERKGWFCKRLFRCCFACSKYLIEVFVFNTNLAFLPFLYIEEF